MEEKKNFGGGGEEEADLADRSLNGWMLDVRADTSALPV